MYKLQVQRDFIAQHYLTVPNCGDENEWHSHHFRVDVLLEGRALNKNGYLVDITEVENALDTLVDRFRDATLNDLPEFKGLNPSIEHFSRIFTEALEDQMPSDQVETLTVRIWEDEDAWASYST